MSKILIEEATVTKVLEALEGGVDGQTSIEMDEAITALQKAPAEQPAQQQEPVAWRETYGKIIQALAEIVKVQTPDKLFDLDAIPRGPVMHLVQQIRAAIDGYTPPQRQPLDDEQIADYLGDEYHSMTEDQLGFFRLGEQAAHGITKGEA